MDIDFAATWNTYARAWAAPEAEMRGLLDAAVHPGCRYTDPLTQVHGVPALSAYMLDLQRQVPGVHFDTVEFMALHHRSMARWDMLGGDGRVLGRGVSFGEYAADGRLERLTGFFQSP